MMFKTPLALLTLPLALAACASPRVASPTGPAPPCEAARLATQPAAPHETWVVAFDRSTSYPVAVREAGQHELADLINSLVRPGAGAAIHVLFIGSNSYDPANSLPTIVVPAVPPAAEPPPPPPRHGNRFDARERKRYEEDVKAWCDTIAAEVARVERDLAAAADQVRVRTDHLRHYRLPHEAGSDFGSIFLRAEERFGNAPNGSIRRLFLYSDMEPFARQGRSLDQLPALPGVEVFVSHWYCANPVACQRWRSVWNERLAAVGATAVRWFAVGEPLPRDELLAVRAAPVAPVGGPR